MVPSVSGNWMVMVGVGGEYKPDFEGASRSMFSPVPIFSIRRAGSTEQFRGPRDSASIALIDFGDLRAGPAGKFVSSRKATNYSELNGLGDVKTAFELGGFVEYNTIPWDIGVRRAKELVFESRFISADEAARYGLVNRVLATADLERETYAWARRVAENSPEALRMAKIQMNKAQDAQGFTNAVEDSLGDYQAMMHMPGNEMRMEGERRLLSVDLAVKGRRGERFGQ